jgi:hypothetical protein
LKSVSVTSYCRFLQSQEMRYSKMADSVMTLQCYSDEIGVTWQTIDVLEVISAVTSRDSAFRRW